MRLSHSIISLLLTAPLIKTLGYVYEPEENKELIEDKNSWLFDFNPDEIVDNTLTLSSPEDVGVGHTKIIHDLHQRMEKKPPSDLKEYYHYLAHVLMENLCKKNDGECIGRVIKNTPKVNHEFENAFEHFSEVLAPDNFDPIVMESMETLFFSLTLTSIFEDPNHVLRIMNKNYMKLKYDWSVENEVHRLIGLLAYSVGIESTKQWYEILNTPMNPFLNFISDANGDTEHDERKRQRKLQQLDFVNLIESDVIGAAAGAVSTGFDILGNTQNGTIIRTSLEQASLFSARQVVTDLTPGNNNDDSDCLFPNSPFCQDNNNNDDNPNNCLFPNSPFCNTTEDPDNPDNCLFPNSPFCQNNQNNEENSTDTDDNPNNCLFPNSPFCQNNQNNQDNENSQNETLTGDTEDSTTNNGNQTDSDNSDSNLISNALDTVTNILDSNPVTGAVNASLDSVVDGVVDNAGSSNTIVDAVVSNTPILGTITSNLPGGSNNDSNCLFPNSPFCQDNNRSPPTP